MAQDKVDQYFAALAAEITDVLLRVEALRKVLHESGLVPRERFDLELKVMKEKYAVDFQKELLRRQETDLNKLIRELLESHEGTEQ